jgi:hypothetical protein
MSLSLCPQIQFDDRKEGDVRNNCLLLVDGADFQIAVVYLKPFRVTSSKRVVFGMRWVYTFRWETFAGEVGLMPQGSGMTCQFSGTFYY